MTKPDRKLSVAPMMDWTDRHCRFFHRLMSRHVLLYTEMVTAQAVVFGDRNRLLGFHPDEHPLALQLGGSDPALLAQATKIAVDAGYDEVNLNVGCPSDRVQSGTFGAVLMKSPDLVAECAAAMIAVSQGVEITVKCRIGVDQQDPHLVLPDFLETVGQAGVRSFAIHARKAWLDGLSPKQNRDIPPLDYPLVLAMKQAFPAFEIAINGGIGALDQAQDFLARGLDGVMVGRAAYHHPFSILGQADRALFGDKHSKTELEVAEAMLPYIGAHIQSGGGLNHITRHMLGLFSGQPGARQWRRALSENSHKPGAGVEVVQQALGTMARSVESRAS